MINRVVEINHPLQPRRNSYSHRSYPLRRTLSGTRTVKTQVSPTMRMMKSDRNFVAVLASSPRMSAAAPIRAASEDLLGTLIRLR